MNISKFIAELKRRNVIKSSIAYLAVSWVLLQVLSIVLPLVEAPIWVLKTLILLMLIGFPLWTIFSWAYEITPEGIKKTKGEIQEKQDITKIDYNKFIIIALVVALVFLLLKPRFTSKLENDNIVIPDVKNETILKPEKAIEILNAHLKNNPNHPNLNSVYAIILASQSQNNAANKKIDIAKKFSREFIHAHHTYYHLGIALAIMNNKHEAIQWLNKAAKNGFPNYPLFNSDPNLSSLKEDKEYQELLMELQDKWEYFKTF